jgi:hypothetical protein
VVAKPAETKVEEKPKPEPVKEKPKEEKNDDDEGWVIVTDKSKKRRK